MKIAAVVCSLVLFLLTCFVLVTDGVSREPLHLAVTALLLLVPALTVLALSRPRRHRTHRAAIAGNLLLLGLICWNAAAEFPHPREEGAFAQASLVLFVLATLIAPTLNVVALFRGTRKG